MSVLRNSSRQNWKRRRKDLHSRKSEFPNWTSCLQDFMRIMWVARFLMSVLRWCRRITSQNRKNFGRLFPNYLSSLKQGNKRTLTLLSLLGLSASIPKSRSSLLKLCTNSLKRLSYMHLTSQADTEHSRLIFIFALMLRLQLLSLTVWFTTEKERLRRFSYTTFRLHIKYFCMGGTLSTVPFCFIRFCWNTGV